MSDSTQSTNNGGSSCATATSWTANYGRSACVALIGCAFAPATTCKNCPVGRSTLSAAAECDECASGQYQHVVAQVSCISCDLGKWAAQVGQTGCDACSAGQERREHQTGCMPCPAGEFQATAGQPRCITCARGQWVGAPAGDSDSCTSTLADNVTVALSDITNCNLAPSTDQGTTAGTCADVDATVATCAYVPVQGATACIACLAGFASAINLATAVGDCVACTAGQTSGTTAEDCTGADTCVPLNDASDPCPAAR